HPGVDTHHRELGLVGRREDRADLQPQRRVDQGIETGDAHRAPPVICARQARSHSALPSVAIGTAIAPAANGAQAMSYSARSTSPATIRPASSTATAIAMTRVRPGR